MFRHLPTSLLVALHFVGACAAFPIEPHSLPTLCQKSDLVVIARVTEVSGAAAEGAQPDRAALTLLSVLKGQWKRPTARVLFNSNSLCPAPPSYEEGETIVVFLKKNKDGSTFTTVGLSYGVKVLSDDDRTQYVQRLAELLRIQQHSESPQRETMFVEWLVTCIEDGSRLDAFLHLNGDAWPGHGASKNRLSEFAESLDDSQVNRLMDVLYTELMANPQQSPFCADQIMEAVAMAKSSRKGYALVSLHREFDEVNKDQQPRVVKLFLSTMAYTPPEGEDVPSPPLGEVQEHVAPHDRFQKRQPPRRVGPTRNAR